MDEARMKKLFYFSLAILLGLVLFWFGSKFLFFPNDRLSDTQLFWSGLLVSMGGVLMLSSPDFRNVWKISLLIIVTGLYFFARAAGVIEMPWLARILGVASWLAALLMLYIAWPGRKPHLQKDDSERPQT